MIKKIKELFKNRRSCDFTALKCYQPWLEMIIRPDGLVHPCNNYYGKGESLREKTLKEIWKGEIFNKIRTEICSNNLRNECQRCVSSFVVRNNKIQALLKNELKKE